MKYYICEHCGNIIEYVRRWVMRYKQFGPEGLTFEKAKEYRNSYGRYLRRNQWRDIEIEVWMLI